MLIDKTRTNISGSNSILSFETTGGGSWEVWDRYLAIDGKPAYHIGNICGTCAFFFERMEGANQSLNPEEIVDALNAGIESLDKSVLGSLEEIIPDGEYLVLLEEVSPKLTTPGSETDYFSNEQVELWGIDGFWGMPHFPKTEYYRLSSSRLSKDIGVYEFLVPTFPHGWLNAERVEEYREAVRAGKKPTMVAISVFDVKEPALCENEVSSVSSHWCMAHYLVDGHHKAYAAALENKPITVVSFLAVEHSISSEEDRTKLMAQFGKE